MRFRARPVEVAAIRWTGANPADVLAFCGPATMVRDGDAFVIPAMHGDLPVLVGDWIVRDTDGSLRPCSDELFREWFESVDAETPPP